jgi:hypothetical protein
MELAVVPPLEGFFLGSLLEHHTGFHGTTAWPRNLKTQLDVIAQEIVDRELGMEDARGARPFWKFVRNVPHDHFGWPTPGRRFRQISERLHVEDRANDRHEEIKVSLVAAWAASYLASLFGP